MISGIYKITSPKGRIYIGLSSDIKKRWNSYRYLCNIKSQKLLHNSIKKYGYDNHSFEILEQLENIPYILEQREIYWINHFKSYYYENKRIGLNLTKGGNRPNKQCKPKTKEHKLKIGLANKGKKHTEESIIKIKEKRKLQVFTKEQNEFRASKIRGLPSKLKGRKRPEISQKLKGIQSAISIPVKIIDKKTGITYTAPSVIKASNLLGIPVHTLHKIRKGLPTKIKNIEFI